MAKATPVTAAPEAVNDVVEGPAPAEEKLMEPVETAEEKAVKKAAEAVAAAAAATADPVPELVEIRDSALAEGKNAVMVSPRAVRVDN